MASIGTNFIANDMKINFKKFPLYTGISRRKTTPMDISLAVCEGIYGNSPGVQAHSLAMKIYQSDGDVELDVAEVQLLHRSMDLFVGIIADSVRDYIDNYKEE